MRVRAVALALLLSCSPQGWREVPIGEPYHETKAPRLCEHQTCEWLRERDRDGPRPIEGASLGLIDNRPVYPDRPLLLDRECRLVASWSLLDGGPFEWTGWVVAGDVFALRAGLGLAAECHGFVGPHNHEWLEMGFLPAAPNAAHPALAPGDIIVPFDGEASLDHVRATVVLHEPWSEIVPRVTLTVGDPLGPRSRYVARTRGDEFAWGARAVKIARIVPPHHGVSGWVDVAL
jgi:hypothetical protein